MIYLKAFEDLTNDSETPLSNFIGKVKKAKKLATKSHIGTYRIGVDGSEKVPYIIHPNSVAKIVHKVKTSKNIADLIAAAYLHDTVEDTDITLEDIRKEFGEIVMNLVNELTSDKEKIKIQGKEKYLIDKMVTMSSWALVIKLADRLHNLSDIEEIIKTGNDKRKKWARRYVTQTKNIINELEASRMLSGTQNRLVKKIKRKLTAYI